MTIDESHIDAASALIAAKWSRQLCILRGDSEVSANAAVSAAQGRIVLLAEYEQPPTGIKAAIDVTFERHREALVGDVGRLTLVVSDPALGSLLHPEIDPSTAEARLELFDQMLAALDDVWTSGRAV